MVVKFALYRQVPSSKLNQLEEYQWPLVLNYPTSYFGWFLQLILHRPSAEIRIDTRIQDE